jgi:2-polyprenyl-6-methoxyphenol hydroxylase-like FAD-dependent oxidoreductase
VILPPRALRRVHPLLGMGMALTLQDVLATVQARATHSSRV